MLWERSCSNGFKIFFKILFRFDPFAHKVCRATQGLVGNILMHFIQSNYLRNFSVETIDDVEIYDQRENLFRIFNE